MAKKPKGRRQSKADVERVLRGPTRRKPKPPKPGRRHPHSQPLPGMEDVRIRALDDVCVSISETREQANELRQTDAELLTKALTLMRKHERTTWRHAGVELVRVPGEEKIRVRTSKEAATAETVEEPAGGDTGAPEGSENLG